jgi:uncharacterized coiled-coil protein SlyX
MDDTRTNERLERLEASQAYAERALETLDEEVRLLNERVAEVRRRLAAMENRLQATIEALERDDDAADDTVSA